MSTGSSVKVTSDYSVRLARPHVGCEIVVCIPVHVTFEDKASEKDTNRPALSAMLRHLRAGDTVFVYSLDRLGRDLVDLRTLIRDLSGRGVEVRFRSEELVFNCGNDAMADLMLGLLGAVAQSERTKIGSGKRKVLRKQDAPASTKAANPHSTRPSDRPAEQSRGRSVESRARPQVQHLARNCLPIPARTTHARTGRCVTVAITGARVVITDWRQEFNHDRQHRSL